MAAVSNLFFPLRLSQLECTMPLGLFLPGDLCMSWKSHQHVQGGGWVRSTARKLRNMELSLKILTSPSAVLPSKALDCFSKLPVVTSNSIGEMCWFLPLGLLHVFFLLNTPELGVRSGNSKSLSYPGLKNSCVQCVQLMSCRWSQTLPPSLVFILSLWSWKDKVWPAESDLRLNMART